MKWRKEPLKIEDLNGKPEAYFWVRGWNFNRPIIIRVNAGVRSEVIDGVRKFRPEINFMFGSDYPEIIWASDLEKYSGALPLEFTGPIPRPDA